jgi:hypothetical protein
MMMFEGLRKRKNMDLIEKKLLNVGYDEKVERSNASGMSGRSS